jgi:hypothetical protein
MTNCMYKLTLHNFLFLYYVCIYDDSDLRDSPFYYTES